MKEANGPDGGVSPGFAIRLNSMLWLGYPHLIPAALAISPALLKTSQTSLASS